MTNPMPTPFTGQLLSSQEYKQQNAINAIRDCAENTQKSHHPIDFYKKARSENLLGLS